MFFDFGSPCFYGKWEWRAPCVARDMHRRFGIAALSFALTSATALAATLGACSSSSDASTPATTDAGDGTNAIDATVVDADNGAPSTTYPAPHDGVPQVQTFGGPVLKAPRIVPIFFPGDEFEIQVETYLQQLAANNNWATMIGEYGAGPLTIAPSIILAAAPPPNVAGTDIDTLIQQVALGNVALQGDSGTPTTGSSNDLYLIFYPTDVTITDAPNYVVCQQAGGYHTQTAISTDGGTEQVTYALIPRCPMFAEEEGLSDIDEVTATLSHEVAESVTDPVPATQAAYLVADYDHNVWSTVLAGSEVADLCSWEIPANSKPTGIDFETARVWSNAAALAGHDPCIPAPTDPYFQALPQLTDSVTIPEYYQEGANGEPVVGGKTKGVKLAKVGDSETIDVEIYSDGATASPITVTTQELTPTGQAPYLSFALDRDSGLNGERLHLTVTRERAAAQGHGESGLVRASLGQPTATGRTAISMIYVSN